MALNEPVEVKVLQSTPSGGGAPAVVLLSNL
jgi:hypothetical protein